LQAGYSSVGDAGHVIETIGDDNIVVATDFSHPEGRRYAQAVADVTAQSGVSDDSKRKMMWDNALRLYALESAV
jgi:predicted TIM-barrel fold metal-dependent hydrolase